MFISYFFKLYSYIQYQSSNLAIFHNEQFFILPFITIKLHNFIYTPRNANDNTPVWSKYVGKKTFLLFAKLISEKKIFLERKIF